ncbi:MAG: RtcB family protein [Firmicutes bacterium]|nr:RtcB family protein [Bacillota bacterium]
MIRVEGKYNEALCYCASLDKVAEGQIKAVCDQSFFADNKIRIMPDVHAGMGCTIGTTMTITDKVVPGMVGVDIGCGMETIRIREKEIDFEQLDRVIREGIPSGRNIRKTAHPFHEEIDLEALCCGEYVNLHRARRSIGTLGGGNHFIEVNKDEEGNLYLVVHSGSRHLGNEVAKYYQEEGFRALCGSARFQIEDMIREMKAQGRSKEIEKQLKQLRKARALATPVPKDLAYVEGRLFDEYIHDMNIIQKFAMLNRKAMVDVIIRGMGLTVEEQFTTIHNYIDIEEMILRKGAISAKKGEKILIPMNMRDGSLICMGKGNEDWNCSAPHGAGRLMSRRDAFETLSVADYAAQMEGIYTTCVSRSTLDEAPMAYKPMEEIKAQIEPTAEIIAQIKPLYNFKASE